MTKKNLLAWMAFLILSGGIVFLFRYPIINWLQQKILHETNKSAVVNNAMFAYQDSSDRKHLIYSLTGIDRIWPHRVNSLERLSNLYNQFKGFECDIRFDVHNHQLYIAHEKNEVSSLKFTDYLKADPAHKLFWLDTKNLDSSSVNDFCKTLTQLDDQFGIKERVIIESRDTSVLILVEKLGYLTSLYLPNVNFIDSSALKIYISRINFFLKNHHVLISQDISMHDFMTKNFPGKKQLIWDIHFWNSLNNDILLKHSNDTTILICLINVKSTGYM